MDRSQLSEQFMKAKNLSASTLKTYVSLVATFAKRLGITDTDSFSEEPQRCIEAVHEQYQSAQTRKTVLAALFVLTSQQAYRDSMVEQIGVVKEMYKERKLEGQRASTRISYSQVREIVEDLERKYDQAPNPTNLIDYLLAAITSGYYGEDCPPRRLLEWATLKWEGDKKTENVVDWKRNVFVLNKYKTAASIQRRTGSTTQLVTIPKSLRPLLHRLKRMHLADYVFVNRGGKPFTSSSLSQRLTSIFGFAVDQLRSIYISDQLYHDGMLRHLEQQAELMGHSVEAQREFYVKDA